MDKWIKAKLFELMGKRNVFMKLVGKNTWLITTNKDKKGCAVYYNGEEKGD